MKTVVYGLWHLGCVTAACLANAGGQVVGLDGDEDVVRGLGAGRPPLDEPGLADRIAGGLRGGRLSFTTDADAALRDASVLWVAFDTPVNERDEADVAWVRGRLDAIADVIRPGTLVLVSSQVPVGFTAALERDWRPRGLRYAYSPENLRLGQALQGFDRPERIVVGVRDPVDLDLLAGLFRPFSNRIEWMSIESAEMTKHALNAFLATSVAFANEVARVCEAVGADAKDVERGLKSEGRIGPRAYLSPGAAFAGGTLARDVRFLAALGGRQGVATPLLDGVMSSNDVHKAWLHETVRAALRGTERPVAAVLGLTYKPGTSTLRRSASVELCRWLRGEGVAVRAHDPAVPELPADLRDLGVVLCASAQEAVSGADVAVVATEWPDYRGLGAGDLVRAMRRPRVIDPNWFLAAALSAEPRLTYIATGRSPKSPGAKP
jgi:UDPglucose 6-dehydrogenase